MKQAALISAAIVIGSGLIAYHPHHPFGWGKATTAPACQSATDKSTGFALPGVAFCTKP